MRKRAQDVFIPGALPESTYITRKTRIGFTYEERLKQALSMNGYLTSISGPSKIGKTVLCEKVVGLERLIEVSGSDFNEKEQLWVKIGTKAGMPFGGETVSGNISDNAMKESYILTKESVIDYYKSHDLVLLLDDFHYADEQMQRFMAQQFKDAIRKGVEHQIENARVEVAKPFAKERELAEKPAADRPAVDIPAQKPSIREKMETYKKESIGGKNKESLAERREEAVL